MLHKFLERGFLSIGQKSRQEQAQVAPLRSQIALAALLWNSLATREDNNEN
jgi:hypothetical protein